MTENQQDGDAGEDAEEGDVPDWGDDRWHGVVLSEDILAGLDYTFAIEGEGTPILMRGSAAQPGAAVFAVSKTLLGADPLVARTLEGDFLPMLQLPDEATRDAVAQLSRKPAPSSFVPRVGPRHVGEARGHVASIISAPNPGPLPTNEVGTHFVAHLLEPSTRLPPPPGDPELSTGRVDGILSVYETHWEPLGWALDDWIDTDSLGPFEDSVAAESRVGVESSISESSLARSRARRRDRQASSSSTEEVMSIGTESRSTASGLDLGLGASQSNGFSFGLDPVLALTRAVTGAFQLGYSTSSSASAARTDGTMASSIGARLEQASSQLRSKQTEAMMEVRNDFVDSRQLRARTNLAPGTTLNMALFSTVRQWLVTTQKVREEPVVFVPIHNASKKFILSDVFRYRSVLSQVMLDPSLAGALQSTAATYRPGSEAAEPGDPIFDWIRGTIKFAANAEGGTDVEIRALFRSGAQPSERNQRIRADQIRAHEEVDIDISLNTGHSVSDFIGLEFRYNNPRLKRIREVTLLELDVQLGPAGLGWRTTPVQLPHSEWVSVYYTRPDVPFERERIVEHLNNNLVYYRLAIDLDTDSVTRYARLGEGGTESLRPSDARPLGVAGAHLAFHLDTSDQEHDDRSAVAKRDEQRENEARWKRDSHKQVLSTPAGGTFLEALPGVREAAKPPQQWPAKEHVPKIVGGAEHGYGWPKLFQPDSPTFARPVVGDDIDALTGLSAPTGQMKLLATLEKLLTEAGLSAADLAAAAKKAADDTASAADGTATSTDAPGGEEGESGKDM